MLNKVPRRRQRGRWCGKEPLNWQSSNATALITTGRMRFHFRSSEPIPRSTLTFDTVDRETRQSHQTAFHFLVIRKMLNYQCGSQRRSLAQTTPSTACRFHHGSQSVFPSAMDSTSVAAQLVASQDHDSGAKMVPLTASPVSVCFIQVC